MEVALATGSTTMRQLPCTRTLLTREVIQPIVPLGLLAELGCQVTPGGTKFELRDREGQELTVVLEASCPMVDEQFGLELIKQVESFLVRRRALLAVLSFRLSLWLSIYLSISLSS